MPENEAPADATQASAALARLWRLPTSQRAGRPPALDTDTAVAAAVRLADTQGLGAVTLDKVAQTLGFTKMALYRHVGPKDQLLELMNDAAVGAAPGIHRPPSQWREALTECALTLRRRYTRHGWLLQIPVGGPPRGPHAISWLDVQLHALRDEPLDWAAKLGLLMPLDAYVRQACLQEQQMRASRGDRDQIDVEIEYGATLARLIDPERYPDAARMFTANPFSETSTPNRDIAADDFRFGLDVVLDGIAAALTRSRHGS